MRIDGAPCWIESAMGEAVVRGRDPRVRLREIREYRCSVIQGTRVRASLPGGIAGKFFG